MLLLKESNPGNPMISKECILTKNQEKFGLEKKAHRNTLLAQVEN